MYPNQTFNDKNPPYPGFNTMPTPYSSGPSNNSLPYPTDNYSYRGENSRSTPPYPGQGYSSSSGPGYPSSRPDYTSPGLSYPPSGSDYSSGPRYPSLSSGYPSAPNAGYTPPTNPFPSSQIFGQPTVDYQQNPSLQKYMNQGNVNQQSYMNNPNPGSYGQQPSYGQPPAYSSQASYGQPMNPAPYGQPAHAQQTSYGQVTIQDFSPSIRDFPNFDGRLDAEALRKAMKGFGTDEKAIINVLAKRTNRQRQQIIMQYKMLYGKDLISDLKSELSGKFESVVLALLTPTYEYDARALRGAIKGLGTDEDLLIEILSSRNPSDIRQIKQVYQQMFNRDLEKDIINDTSGHFRRLLVSLATGMRDEGTNVDPNMAHRDAEALVKAGVKKIGTDESVFNSILASRNFNQIRAAMNEYQRIAGHTLQQAIMSEMSGDLLNGMLSVAKCAQNRPAYFAEKLYLSMKGLGTNDDMLIRIIVTRCEVDMIAIKNEFQRMYGKSLESFISGDCSGDYKHILMALVQGNV